MEKHVEHSTYRNELLLKLFFGASIPPTILIKHLEAQQKKISNTLKEYDYTGAYILSEVPDDDIT